MVAACAQARDAKACDPALAGSDDRIPLTDAANAEMRKVRYDWLRALLTAAQKKDAAPEKHDKTLPAAGPAKGEATRPPPPTTSQLLKAAEERLAADADQALALAGGAAGSAAQANGEAGAGNAGNVRNTMKQVLSGRDFRNLEAPTAKDSALEKFSAWPNSLFEGLGKLRPHAAWLGAAIVWGFVLTVCVGLAWGLLQMERRWRIRLVPESDGPAAGAASARDWQLWLADARRSAAAGAWREAIHFVYWASISRLESKRLWPADRARTPREYLALVAGEDPRKPRLAALTGSFERTWYGGRAAGESDYRKAEELAGELIGGGATQTSEGGAR